jgi:hypothetical protein
VAKFVSTLAVAAANRRILLAVIQATEVSCKEAQNEEDVASHRVTAGDSQLCWLWLLQLVHAETGSLPTALSAGAGMRSVRDGADDIRRGAASRRSLHTAAAVVIRLRVLTHIQVASRGKRRSRLNSCEFSNRGMTRCNTRLPKKPCGSGL